MIDVDACLTFLDFVQERHSVWEKRQAGEPQPWTDDPVLATRKFTNVFRLLDPGSQFVITDLLEDELPPEEFLMRCFLYRHTGRVETWQHLEVTLGRYPLIEDLDDVLKIWTEYRGLGKTSKRGAGDRGAKGGADHKVFDRPIFTGAYLVFPQSAEPGTDKLESIIRLTQRLACEGAFTRFVDAGSQTEKFAALRSNKGVADFMSMQVLTDFGYSTEFRENQFVVSGPGARRGALALGMEPEDAVEWAYQAVQYLGPVPLVWGSGKRGHFMSRMDVQNCLCEFSKYVRFASKPSPQKPYSPAHPGVQSTPVLPPGWHQTI